MNYTRYKLSSCSRNIYRVYSLKHPLKSRSNRPLTVTDSKSQATRTTCNERGQIFDDKSNPLAGVKVSISRTSLIATSDAQGKFELNNIPPGRIDLFIDGRTVNPNVSANAQSALDVNQPPTSPSYPSLHFEAYAVKGRNNQLAHPTHRKVSKFCKKHHRAAKYHQSAPQISKN